MRNSINAVLKTDGPWADTPEQVAKPFTDFYRGMLGTKAQERIQVDKGVIGQGKILEASQHSLLNCNFIDDEIRGANFSIPSSKAPRIDGYNSAFYKGAWEVVGNVVCKVVQEFFSNGKLLSEINVTIISLILKVPVHAGPRDYKPIAYCNVIYKCITKLLCKRLSKVLPDNISFNQGAFISGRNIMHNVLICQDLVKMHSSYQKQPCFMLKLDTRKAYDTVEWDFLEETMIGLNFPHPFIQLVMTCVRTLKFCLLINGSPTELFTPQRGLRQGDPLSPLIFTLCMEYYSRILQKVGCLEGFKFHTRYRSLKLNHLAFADDILIFSRGEVESTYMLLSGVHIFSDTTGLHVNAKKSKVYYAGMKEEEVSTIKRISSFKTGMLLSRYPNVPLSHAKLKVSDCDMMIDKMCARIKTWKSRNISYAGRLQLINSVLMSICTYWSQIFTLPIKVTQKIDSICRHFLWNGHYMSSKPGLVNWDKVCMPNQVRGLDIRNLEN
ncbi:LINE-1 reverse transcriptase-like protein [Bienertia sinuspersici]